jgi:hypothetical protein
MANYQNIVNACRSAVPSGERFIHGRLIDFSQDYTGTYPLITLLPFTVNDFRSTTDAIFDFASITVGFWKEDSPDTTADQRETIISDMDVLSDQFINKLLESNKIKVSAILKEPQYQMFQGTLSGFAISFRIDIIAPC